MVLDDFKEDEEGEKTSYRPRIPPEVHEKVEMRYIGEPKNLNEVYINAVGPFLDEFGKEAEWLSRISKYCEDREIDRAELLDKIITQVINENGEADIKFKQKLDL